MRTKIKPYHKASQVRKTKVIAEYEERVTRSSVTIVRDRDGTYRVRSHVGFRFVAVTYRSSRAARREARRWMNRFRVRKGWLRPHG